MSGIFPNGSDGGLAPNPAEPTNPSHAYPPVTPPTGTSALYYGNGCDVRLRPEVVNSIISELEATCDEAKYSYDVGKLDNVEHAVRYLIQRGLAVSALALNVSENLYSIALDPKATGYNDFMVLCIVPTADNTGPVQLNLDGYGYRPLLRNDARSLVARDLRVDIPLLICSWHGAWYALAPLPSQLSQIGNPIVWVRTDGVDDTNHDGSANDPQHAFKTVQYAAEYAQNVYLLGGKKLFINLGNAGTYLGFYIKNPMGNVTITGDKNAPASYIIETPNPGFKPIVGSEGLTMTLIGMQIQSPGANNNTLYISYGGQVILSAMRIGHTVPSNGYTIVAYGGAAITVIDSLTLFANFTAAAAVTAQDNGTFTIQNGGSVTMVGSPSYTYATLYANNGAIDCIGPINGFATGYYYSALYNGVIHMYGKPIPGNGAGFLASGGQFG